MPPCSALVLLLGVAACAPTSPPSRGRAAPSASVTPVALPRRPPALRPVVCGFGGVGPQGPGDAPNAWGIALVEVTAAEAALSGVHGEAITLLDASDLVLAHATRPIEARVVPPGQPTNDFSPYGTTPFGSGVARGGTVVLRLEPSCVHPKLNSYIV